MAKQAGQFVFTGTVGDATGYKMNGKYYLKTKSEISRRKIRTHRNFSLTRRNAKWFGEAVKLAQKIYYELPPDERDQYKTWYPLRNRAQELVRKGTPEEEIVRLLREEFGKREASVVRRELSIVNRESSIVNRESPIMNRELSVVNGELSIVNHQPETLELPKEIFLGRVIHPAVELSLTDQLAASVAFVKNFLQSKVERKESFYVKAGRLRLRR
jgi:hypothetical protein